MYILLIIEKESSVPYQEGLKWDAAIERLDTILSTSKGVERLGANVLVFEASEALHLFSEVCVFLDNSDAKPKYRCLFLEEAPEWVMSKKIRS